MKNLVNSIAVDMVWYREAYRENEAHFIENTMKKILKGVYKDNDLNIHADYINEKFKAWKTCDIDSLKRIITITA